MHPQTREHLMTAMRDAAFSLARGKVGEQERARRERLLTAMRNLDPADPAE